MKGIKFLFFFIMNFNAKGSLSWWKFKRGHVTLIVFMCFCWSWPTAFCVFFFFLNKFQYYILFCQFGSLPCYKVMQMQRLKLVFPQIHLSVWPCNNFPEEGRSYKDRLVPTRGSTPNKKRSREADRGCPQSWLLKRTHGSMQEPILEPGWHSFGSHPAGLLKPVRLPPSHVGGLFCSGVRPLDFFTPLFMKRGLRAVFRQWEAHWKPLTVSRRLLALISTVRHHGTGRTDPRGRGYLWSRERERGAERDGEVRGHPGGNRAGLRKPGAHGPAAHLLRSPALRHLLQVQGEARGERLAWLAWLAWLG